MHLSLALYARWIYRKYSDRYLLHLYLYRLSPLGWLFSDPISWRSHIELYTSTDVLHLFHTSIHLDHLAPSPWTSFPTISPGTTASLLAPQDPNLPGMSPAGRRQVYARMASTLCALHSVDPVAAGLASYGSAAHYCSRQVWGVDGRVT